MSTIVTRAGKGSPLTHTEVDNNFTNLNTDKLQSGDTAASLTITSADINGGTIDGTTVGATTASTGAFTSLSDSGNLTFTGTGNRITGDFSNSTVSNRVAFQTSTTNGNTLVNAIPNGTGVVSRFRAFNSSDPDNSSWMDIGATTDRMLVQSSFSGTGSYLPMTFSTGGTERLRIDTSGNLLFNSGYGSVATAYGCRAWVNFNGTGTVAIRASGNVSSITDNATGQYTVNFTTAMPDANYSVCGGASSSNCEAVIRMLSYATGSVAIQIVDSNVPAFTDDSTISVAVFR